MNIGERIPEVLGIDQHGNEIKSRDYLQGAQHTFQGRQTRNTARRNDTPAVRV